MWRTGLLQKIKVSGVANIVDIGSDINFGRGQPYGPLVVHQVIYLGLLFVQIAKDASVLSRSGTGLLKAALIPFYPMGKFEIR